MYEDAATTGASSAEVVEELLRQLVDARFVLTDRDGSVTRWGRPAEELFGWPSARMLGRPLSGHRRARRAAAPERRPGGDHREAQGWERARGHADARAGEHEPEPRVQRLPRGARDRRPARQRARTAAAFPQHRRRLDPRRDRRRCPPGRGRPERGDDRRVPRGRGATPAGGGRAGSRRTGRAGGGRAADRGGRGRRAASVPTGSSACSSRPPPSWPRRASRWMPRAAMRPTRRSGWPSWSRRAPGWREG